MDFFELNSWGLKDAAVRRHAAAAFSHSLQDIQLNPLPPVWPCALVDPCHLFACGATRSGGMHASRQVLELLLSQGANLNAVDASGWVPLSYAAWFGLASTLDLLLEAGADVHPDNAQLPLTTALTSFGQRRTAGADTCARLLLMSGAEPRRSSISDTTGRSSFLSWALATENLEWANLLHAKGDSIRSDRELSILLWQAPAPALNWLQVNGYNVLAKLPSDHPHRNALFQAQVERRRQALGELVVDRLQNKEEDQDGHRAM